MSQFGELKVFSGRAHEALADAIAKELNTSLAAEEIGSFPDGEVRVQIEESVRGADVFLVQPTSPPVNDNLMELLVIADALKRASAGRITAVVPYFGYARQDKKATGREPITAKLVADLMQTAGIQRVITMDLHAAQIQGFFNIPVDHLTALGIIAEHYRRRDLYNTVVVTPDAGRAKHAKRLSDMTNLPLGLLHKRRVGGNGEPEITTVIGEVEGLRVIMIDDIVSTGGTIQRGVEALMNLGALDVSVAATHPVLVGPAIECLTSPGISEVVFTDTVPLPPGSPPAFKILSVAPLIANAIARVHTNKSVSTLFEEVSALF